MSLYQSSAPATEPVSQINAKAHINLTVDDDDAMVATLITAARQQVESFLRRSLITQTWELRLDCFPSGVVKLPNPPIASVSSIVYVDTDGVSQTWDSAEYQVDTKSSPGRLIPAYGYSYPSTRFQMDAVTITFVTGYGAASAVPEDIKQAILLMVGEMYENREESVIGATATQLPLTAERLLFAHRVLEV